MATMLEVARGRKLGMRMEAVNREINGNFAIFWVQAGSGHFC
jgi:hypothetical protein